MAESMIRRPAHVRDVEELIAAAVEANGLSLEGFKSIWRQRAFSFIHDACPKGMEPRGFVQSLFAAALDCLPVPFSDSSLPSAVAVLFTLHCLFHSQHLNPPALIYLPLEMLPVILELVREAKWRKLPDAFLVGRSLILGRAFLYGAIPNRQREVSQKQAEARVMMERKLKVLREKLFARIPVRHHFTHDLVQERDALRADLAWQQYEAARVRLVKGRAQQQPGATTSAIDSRPAAGAGRGATTSAGDARQQPPSSSSPYGPILTTMVSEFQSKRRDAVADATGLILLRPNLEEEARGVVQEVLDIFEEEKEFDEEEDVDFTFVEEDEDILMDAQSMPVVEEHEG